MTVIDRRRFERFNVAPMYTPVTVRRIGEDQTLEGHVYDIGEGGLRFELDRPVEVGSEVVVKVTLPGPAISGAQRSIYAFGRVAWSELDGDEPGPIKMAAEFTGFASRLDKERLVEQVGFGPRQGGLERVA